MHPVDGPDREMKGEIDGAGQAEPGETLGNPRANALERLDFREQGIEQVGAHRAADPSATRRDCLHAPDMAPAANEPAGFSRVRTE